jgi:hypothetical protein
LFLTIDYGITTVALCALKAIVWVSGSCSPFVRNDQSMLQDVATPLPVVTPMAPTMKGNLPVSFLFSFFHFLNSLKPIFIKL